MTMARRTNKSGQKAIQIAIRFLLLLTITIALSTNYTQSPININISRDATASDQRINLEDGTKLRLIDVDDNIITGELVVKSTESRGHLSHSSQRRRLHPKS